MRRRLQAAALPVLILAVVLANALALTAAAAKCIQHIHFPEPCRTLDGQRARCDGVVVRYGCVEYITDTKEKP